MVKQRSKFFLSSTLFLVLALLLTACGGSSEPSNVTQNTSTPTATTASSQPGSTPAAGAQQPDGNYAFVRQNQLWVHLQGDISGQLTKFDYTRLPNSFWHQSRWSSDARYLAFIMNALPEGLGGGGCPGPDYGANGVLYVYDTQAKVMTQVTPVTPLPHASPSGQPLSDAWQYMFWEDATHLLAWYNGIKDGKNAGLYRYDLTAQTVKKVVSLDSLDANTLYNGKTDDKPLILSMRYSSGTLYYQTVKHPSTKDSTLSIYSHSVTKPGSDSQKVLDLGNEPWCDLSNQPGPIVIPGWDVSPDGNHLVTQLVSSQAVMGIQEKNLQNGSSIQLFQQVSGDFLGHDVLLAWSPDSQTVVATEPSIITRKGPYTTSLSNASVFQTYTPYMRGAASWRADSSAFDLQDSSTGNGAALISGSNTPPIIYEFGSGKTNGQAVFTDAHEIGWG